MFGMKTTYLIITVLSFVIRVYGKDGELITVSGNTVRASSGTCGANLTWELSDEGTLTINGTGYMDGYSGWDLPWEANKSLIKNVVIGEGVVSIGNCAFYWCRNLKDVKMPDSLELIGEMAFFECSSMTHVKIGNGVKTIMDDAFWECKNIVNISIGSNLTSIGNAAFRGCTRLMSIEVEKSNTMFSVINGVLFSDNNTVLVQYPIGKTDTTYIIPDHVTKIGTYAFANGKLTNVVITDSVTSVGICAFASCGNLVNLKISNKLKSISEMAFSSCDNLTSVVIPEGVKSILALAFDWCKNLGNITIPESTNYIADSAFDRCPNLKSVFYQGTTPISTSTALGSVESLTNVCTAPGYTSDTFCGANVTPSSEICQTYQSFFSPCGKGSCVDGVVVEMKWDNVTAWEQQTNGCEEYHCDRTTGDFVSWWNCNTTDNVRRACVDGQCITENNAGNDEGWTVELEMNNLTLNEVNESEIREILSNVTGINDMKIGTETDSKGNVVRVIIYVKDEASANIIAETVKKHDYEIFRKSVNVSVKCKENLLSNGYRTMINGMFMLLFIMMITLMQKI